MFVLAGKWWTFVLRGILSILFGVITVIMPGIALLSLILVFAFYAIADGVFGFISAFRREPGQPLWWAMLLQGTFSLIAGLLALFLPGLTAIALLYLIAGWAIASGVMQIVAAIRLRKQITGEWALVLMGGLSIAFGVLAAIFPGAGALAVLLWIGAYMFVFGILLISLGFRLRKWIRQTDSHADGVPHSGLRTA